jgi:hypothetical protein
MGRAEELIIVQSWPRRHRRAKPLPRSLMNTTTLIGILAWVLMAILLGYP